MNTHRGEDLSSCREEADRAWSIVDRLTTENEALREAIVKALGWLERANREQNVHHYREGVRLLTEAIAAIDGRSTE